MEIPAPEKFDFLTEHWPAWKARFIRFRSAADLASKVEVRQVNTLIYNMGDRAEDIFNISKLSETDAGKFNTMLNKYDNYFTIKKNVIFERAQFNLRKQQPGETASSFITVIHKLAETCEYGALREDLIRNRLIAGISDAKLSEKLQMMADLTLEKAITTVRQAEQIHQQQGIVRGPTQVTLAAGDVNLVKGHKPYKGKRGQRQYQPKIQSYQSQAQTNQPPTRCM